MKPSRPTWESLLYVTIRLSPLFASLLFMDLTQLTAESAIKAATRTLIVLAILVFWNMAEGAFILYYREAQAKSEKARGFGLVALGLGVLTLLALPMLRTKVSQPVFVIALAVLALRGVSRSSWEQGKTPLATIATVLGHSLLALLSFALIQEPISWQSVVVSCALGSALTPADMGWYKDAFVGAPQPRLLSALLRVLLFIGPVSIATLTLAGQLPRHYLVMWATLLLAHKVGQKASQNQSMAQLSFRAASGFYLVVVATLYVCNAYAP